MKTVCAICNREIHKDKLSGTASVGNHIIPREKQGEVTHGICPQCNKREERQPIRAAVHESFRNWIERRQKGSTKITV